ncbi:hypothetical protein WJX72_001454 [[Myrmecia] bisecta]|uniref:Translocator protein n=1 Tax=[Myrmecia] bisecta TaxID=41462 RepID=A0AAW1PTW5_9CHLO
MGQAFSVLVAVGAPLAAGVGVGVSISKDVRGWYKTLKKPSWNPPDWIFGPVWTALYSMMGVASWMVWKNGGGLVPLGLYGLQLVMNLAWSPLFFKAHELGYALLDITALLGVLSATIVKFHEVSPEAAYLLLPYLGWTSFAAALTYDIYKKNPKHQGALSEKNVKQATGQAKAQAEGAASTVADKAQQTKEAAGAKLQGASDAAKDAAHGNDAPKSAMYPTLHTDRKAA